ncbi:hypothetical protein [Burkholderia diffusa]|nr:hypothetical protein [Burkholderia diffusa]
MPRHPASRHTFMITAAGLLLAAALPPFAGKRVAIGGWCNAYDPRM